MQSAGLIRTGIKVRLASKNETQSDLAARLGESPFWVSRRLNSQAITIEDADRIAEALGTDLVGLIDLAKAVA